MQLEEVGRSDGRGRVLIGFGELAAKLVDLKGIAKLPNFGGQEKHWQDFRFKFESGAALLDLDFAMTATLELEQMVTLSMLGDQAQARARLLYAILVQLCHGRALALIRLVEIGNGFAAWPRLVEEYEPDQPARHTAMVAGLLTPKWLSQGNFL